MHVNFAYAMHARQAKNKTNNGKNIWDPLYLIKNIYIFTANQSYILE